MTLKQGHGYRDKVKAPEGASSTHLEQSVAALSFFRVGKVVLPLAR